MTEAEYVAQMQIAYQKQEEEKVRIVEKYYPVDPFFDGVWVRAEICSPDIIAKAYYCQNQIEKSGKFKPPQIAVQSFGSPLAGMPLIQVSKKWLETRRQHLSSLVEYVRAVVNRDNERAMEIDDDADDQLSSLLTEASEELLCLSELSSAAVEGE